MMLDFLQKWPFYQGEKMPPPPPPPPSQTKQFALNMYSKIRIHAHCKKMFCKKTVMCWQQSRQQFTVILQYSYCEII